MVLIERMLASRARGRVLACAAAGLLSVFPTQAQGLRLGAVLDLARAADAQYAAALAATDSSREKLPQARATLKPTVNFSYSMKYNRDGSTLYSDTLGYDAGGAALVFNQPLFRPANKATVEQAELLVQLAEQQLALAEQDLLLRVAKGYIDVLQAGDEVGVAVAQKEALQQQFAQAKRSFEVGTVPITDLNEAQARNDLATAQEIASRNELESRKRVLERSIARPLPPLARLKDTASAELLSAEQLRRLVESAPATALQVQIARTAVQVADKEIAKREAGHHPTLDLVGSIGVARNTNYGVNGGTDTRQATIGLELGMPVYQGGAVSSRLREAMADRRRAAEELAQAERQALLDAQQAQLGAQSGAALTLALRQALISSEAQLRSSQRGQQVGVRTRLDVLNAEQQLFATRRDLANARYRTLASALQLKAAAGQLSELDLRSLDALLAD